MICGIGMIRATAFLTRSIRQESRLVSHHVMRGALAIVILGLFAAQLMMSATMGAAGYSFARTIASTSYWFLTVVGLLYFCIAITEEKEEDTLPLIRMTGVSNFSLLIGKSLPRLAIAGLFLMVIAPFVVLSITMGGVVIENLVACLLGMLCYAFLLSQIGLLASVVSSDSRRAIGVASVLWFVFEYGYLVAGLLSFGFAERRWLFLASKMEELASEMQNRSMARATGEYLMLIRGEAIIQPQMTTHVIAGCVCFVLSWLLFDMCSARALGQGVAGDTSHRLTFSRKKNRKSARAAYPALAWKSWYFISGGTRWFVLKLVGVPVLTVSAFVSICVMVDERLDTEVLAVFMMVVGGVLLIIESARSLGRVLNDEIYRKTLGSLLMLPRTVGQIAYPLIAGILPVMIPPACCFFVGMLLLFATEPRAVDDFIEAMREPWMWHFFTWYLLTLHLGVLLSTMLRYGGMLIAVAVAWIAAPTLFFMSIMMLAFFLSRSGPVMENFLQYVLPVGLMMAEMAICALVHRATVGRLKFVAQQS